MAAKLGEQDDDIIADINVTPLVDVVLVLLIIFMVTATYIVAPSIKVTLPQAATGDETHASTLAVVLDQQGQLFLNGEPITYPELEAAVREEKAHNPEVQAVISADKEVSHGEVISIIDLVKLNGVTKFAINIDPAAVKAVREARHQAEEAGGRPVHSEADPPQPPLRRGEPHTSLEKALQGNAPASKPVHSEADPPQPPLRRGEPHTSLEKALQGNAPSSKPVLSEADPPQPPLRRGEPHTSLTTGSSVERATDGASVQEGP